MFSDKTLLELKNYYSITIIFYIFFCRYLPMSLSKTKINWQMFKRIGRKQLFREVMQEGKKESEVAQSCVTLCVPMDCSLPGSSSSIHGIFQARVLVWVAIAFSRRLLLLLPWDFPGKSTGVGCHCLLQEIFPIQGLNPGLPYCRQTLYHPSHQGSLARGKI